MAGGYQGDLLELQRAAFAGWKVEFDQKTALDKLRTADIICKEKSPEVSPDTFLYIQNLANIKQVERSTGFPAFPREYKGELLELQRQILYRWKESVEYRLLLRVKKSRKKPHLSTGRDLRWWEWIPISDEYKKCGSVKKIVGPGEGPGDPGFRSAEYKSESTKQRSQHWDNQTREAYKSLEYKSLDLTDEAKIASHIDWQSRPVDFS